MSSIDIYAILSSKPHNPHYLKRYYNFILACQKKNEEELQIKWFYTENHHFCPKSKDLFPEYKTISQHPWNNVKLTTHQHIIAHVILSKAFGKSQAKALHLILQSGKNEDSPRYGKIPTAKHIRMCATYREATKGTATYKDKDGNHHVLHKDDPKIKAEGLVGVNKGMRMSPATIEKLRLRKQKFYALNGVAISLRFLNNIIKINSIDPIIHDYLEQGWIPYLNDEDRAYIRIKHSERTGLTLKGRVNYALNGEFYGKLSHDDPLIEELGLELYITQNMQESARKSLKFANQANQDTIIYHKDGIEKRFKYDEEVPAGWIEGRAPRSQEWKERQAKATSKKDQKFYNNGIDTILIKPGMEIPEGYVLGMGPRKSSRRVKLPVIDNKDLNLVERYDAITKPNGILHHSRCGESYFQKTYPELLEEIKEATDYMINEPKLKDRIICLRLLTI